MILPSQCAISINNSILSGQQEHAGSHLCTELLAGNTFGKHFTSLFPDSSAFLAVVKSYLLFHNIPIQLHHIDFAFMHFIEPFLSSFSFFLFLVARVKPIFGESSFFVSVEKNTSISILGVQCTALK